MREKLLVLMKNEGLTSSRLAELLGIQPSGISHILAGRNKPSFDLVQKILRRFPNVNPDWLLLDSDQFYRDGGAAPHSPTSREDGVEEVAPSLFAAPLEEREKCNSQESIAEQKKVADTIFSMTSNSSKQVERIIVLYTDKSFDSYTPQLR